MRPTFIHRYPVASFYILALALGAGTVYLVVQGVFPSSLALGAALSASIAGTIMTAVEDGRAGLKLMLGRLLIWRVGLRHTCHSRRPMASPPAPLLRPSAPSACGFPVRWVDRSEGVSGSHSNTGPDVPGPLVCLLQLDLQQY